MKTKLINNNSKELILFLTGWGCDDNQFLNFNSSSKDILLFWDYSTLDFEFDFSKYEEFYLLTYSAGVYVAGLIQNKLPNFKTKIAINGNPLMFDSHFGIDKETLNIMSNLDEKNVEEFIKKYLIFDENDYKEFIKTPALRSFKSSETELKKLEEFYHDFEPVEFDRAILSDSDKIFNPTTQKEYFKQKAKIMKNSAHNVFSKFKSYDEIFDFANN